MVGLGTEKFDITEYRHKFTSLLGSSAESYGLSYTGAVRHDCKIVTHDSQGFCKGSIIGLRLDMWQGTLEFYINRKSQGLYFMFVTSELPNCEIKNDIYHLLTECA